MKPMSSLHHGNHRIINCCRSLAARYCSTQIECVLRLLLYMLLHWLQATIMRCGQSGWGYQPHPNQSLWWMRGNYPPTPMAATPHAATGYHIMRATRAAVRSRRKHDYALSHLVIPPMTGMTIRQSGTGGMLAEMPTCKKTADSTGGACGRLPGHKFPPIIHTRIGSITLHIGHKTKGGFINE